MLAGQVTREAPGIREAKTRGLKSINIQDPEPFDEIPKLGNGRSAPDSSNKHGGFQDQKAL